MKRIIYLSLVVFLIVLGSSAIDNVSGINPGSSTPDKAVSHRFQGGYWTPLICDGVEVDYLEGTLDVHCVMFGHPGAWQWMTMRYTGTLKSAATGEQFRIMEIDKSDATDFSWHSNLVGDNGSHYIIFGSGTFDPFTVTIDKTVCPSFQGE